MYRGINANDLEALCLGCSFLGSGGGGDVHVLYDHVQKALMSHGPTTLIDPNDLNDSHCVVAVEFVGAPLPMEMRHRDTPVIMKPVLDKLMEDLDISIDAVMPVEIGGSNGLVPLCMASLCNLPLVDCDLLGRALPEMSMISTHIFNRMPKEVYSCDPSTGQTKVFTCQSYGELETKARALAASYKTCSAVLVPVMMTGKEVKKMAIHKTISKSMEIGKQKTLEGVCQVTKGVIQFFGTVTQWTYELKNGFLLGKVTIQDSVGQCFSILVKNEFLVLLDNQAEILAEAPDIITLLNQDTLSSILSDQVTVGDKVVCITCKGPELWYTERGLSLLKNSLDALSKL